MKTNENVEEFGARLKSALKRKNMSQSKLSEISGINTSTISEYISGRYEPSRSRIAEFANVLDVNEVWLMGYDVPIERNIKAEKNIRLTTYEKKQLLKNIENVYRQKNKNIESIKKEYNLKTFSADLEDSILLKIAEDLNIPFKKERFLNRTMDSEIKNWFLETLESLSDEELEQLKSMIEPTIAYMKNKK
ncbi:helix-turn-helix domain-containing protein [Leptotrichia trevisanii]|uniref:helix-turn-helix domain-containing protein n=1 Tax=Leptotrichia trevisanii TaxID=109328 RepID=UPI0026EADDC1|nr:helix-turn-helix transcriptional regulator [Leptotrichia trevisanii]